MFVAPIAVAALRSVQKVHVHFRLIRLRLPLLSLGDAFRVSALRDVALYNNLAAYISLPPSLPRAAPGLVSAFTMFYHGSRCDML